MIARIARILDRVRRSFIRGVSVNGHLEVLGSTTCYDDTNFLKADHIHSPLVHANMLTGAEWTS